MNRSLGPSLEGLLVSQAYVAGVDGHLLLDPRRGWVVFGGLAGSSVSGSRPAVLRLQTSAQRYYQRPDAPHVEIDPQATSLSGWSGRIGLNKNSGTSPPTRGCGDQPRLQATTPASPPRPTAAAATGC